jgi:enterochelin esterase-like enzyme
MKKIILLLGALLCVGAFPLSGRSRMVNESVSSKILGQTIAVNVYLPDGFDASKGPYPVLYLLHGLTDDHKAWQERGGLQTVLDELVGTGEAVPMVVVMPRAGDPDTHRYQNGYFNVRNWSYEDFFFGELIPALESRYHCGGAKARRAVSGLSMGGGASVVYCQRHPDMFSSCYAMSPWLDNKNNEVGMPTDKEDRLYLTGASVREHSAVDFMDRADKDALDALRSVKWFLDCGDDDYLLHLSMDLYAKMRQKGVKCEFRVRNGSHSWEYWHTALRLSLPFASRNFSR